MMKKHNEGYTLVLVLVVMLVLTTVATAILTFSVSNLRNQQTMVDRMEAKYEAMGEIEKIVGQLSAETVLPLEEGKEDIEVLTNWINSHFDNQAVTVVEGDNDTWSCSVSLSGTKSVEGGYTYTIICNVDISGTMKDELDNDIQKNVIGYKLSGITVIYTSYEIGGAAS